MKEELTDWWKSHYGSAPPIAHILRQVIHDKWLRIHSLPESKRYPESSDDYSVLLARHNAIATEALGSHSQCLLLIGRYAAQSEPGTYSQSFPKIEDGSFALFDTIYEPAFINIWYAPVIWSEGLFDSLIKSVADGRDALNLFVSLETGAAYAPYDGGADLFLNSSTQRDIFKQKYKQWLSEHKEGL